MDFFKCPSVTQCTTTDLWQKNNFFSGLQGQSLIGLSVRNVNPFTKGVPWEEFFITSKVIIFKIYGKIFFSYWLQIKVSIQHVHLFAPVNQVRSFGIFTLTSNDNQWQILQRTTVLSQLAISISEKFQLKKVLFSVHLRFTNQFNSVIVNCLNSSIQLNWLTNCR